jgi:hypothetical protein
MDRAKVRIMVLDDLRKTMAGERFKKFRKKEEEPEKEEVKKRPSIAVRLMQLEGKK